MLTPVQEKVSDSESSDDENDILVSGSCRKLDCQVLSRSESGLSNPSLSWALLDDNSEVSSLRDSISILSEEENSLPRGFRMNGPNGRKNSKDELCEAPQLNHKGSSQGSDDSSAFIDNTNVFLSGEDYSSSPARHSAQYRSASEGPPTTRILIENEDDLIQDKLGNDEDIQLRIDASAHSSTSMTESEEFESPDSTLKPGKLNRYERYERYRLANPIATDAEIGTEQSQGSTQDSVGTLTDGVPSEIDESSPFGLRKQYGNEREPMTEKWEILRDMHKHVDSGIDERGSPDTRSEKGGSFKRASFPEVIGLQNFRQLIDFNSRESGLADSPDSGSLLSEHHPLAPHSPPDSHSLVTHVLRSPTDLQEQQFMTSVVPSNRLSTEFSSRERRSRSSEPDIGGFHIHTQSDDEMVVDLDPKQSLLVPYDDLAASNESIDDSETEDYLTESLTAPRSLESSLFSSIARNPIPRHTASKDDSMERRPRASSVEAPSLSPRANLTSFSPKHELHYKALAGTKARSSTTTTTTSLPQTTLNSSNASSENDLQSPSKILSKSMSALTFSSPTNSPGTSIKKKKWGKRLHKTFKPALRVLKITPNNNSISAASRGEEAVRDFHLSSHTPEASPSPSEIETGRVRIASPDLMPTTAQKLLATLRRSRSCDQLLDLPNNEASIKVGSFKAVAEPKTKHKKPKFFSSFQGKSKGKSPTPTEVQPQKKKVSLDYTSVENPSKTKKKSRLPHFV